MATGRVNVGGGGGVKKLYRLFKQEEEPDLPKVGDIWVNLDKNSNKTTLSINEPKDHVAEDGELFLQFIHVVQQFDFAEITSKIDGALNTTEFVYDITALREVQLSHYFIPLFQKDVVKQYAILTRIVQYDGDKWVYPEAYYYNGTQWVSMNHKLYVHNYSSQVLKYTKDLVHSQTLNGIGTHGIRVMPNGDFYTHSFVINTGVVLYKYNSDGMLLSQLTFTSDKLLSCIFHIDDYDRIYSVRSNVITNTVHFNNVATNITISVYDKAGLLLFDLNFITTFGSASYILPEIYGIDKNKIYMMCYVAGSYRNFILDMSTLTYEVVDPAQENFRKSNYIFKGDYVYYLADTSTSATVNFTVIKRNRNDFSLIKQAVSRDNPATSDSLSGISYIKGFRYNPSYQNRFYLAKAEGDDFIVFYNLGQSVSSISKIIVDFDLGYPLLGGYMNDVLFSTDTSQPNVASSAFAHELEDSFIILQKALLLRYGLVDGLIRSSDLLNSGKFVLSTGDAKKAAFVDYGIG